jgi:ABC-type Fe3+-hydroxamate transport system substrate-binding protein
MPTFIDQLGRIISMPGIPERIISLVPSQTELLHELGLERETVGITKFCVRPAQWFRNKARVGGTKDLKPDKIHALRPDLIFANKEENNRQQIEELAQRYPVWISDVPHLSAALDMIGMVGQISGKAAAAGELVRSISTRFDSLIPTPRPLRTAYFIWREPWMVAGGGTFIDDMLQRCGFDNVFGDHVRYPAVDPVSLSVKGCDLVLLSSEPYPFKDKHIKELRQVIAGAEIRLADGEMFSWYGSRLLQAPDYFRQLMRDLRSCT